MELTRSGRGCIFFKLKSIPAIPFALLFLLLFLPSFFHLFPDLDRPLHHWKERLVTGDEPSYLMTLVSLTTDHDFELTNNYRTPPPGYAGRLDLRSHHAWVSFPDGSRPIYHGAVAVPEGSRQYPKHGIGLPLLAWPFAAWLPLSPETAIRLVSALSVLLLGLLFFGRLKDSGEPDAAAKTAILLLLTPLWHYGSSLLSEGLIAFLLFLAFDLTLRKKPAALIGLVFCAGMVVKASFIGILPALAWSLFRRGRRDLALFGTVLILFLAGHALWNYLWFSDPFFYNQTQGWPLSRGLEPAGIILSRLRSYLFSFDHGLFLFVPFLAALFIPGNFKSFRGSGAVAFIIGWMAVTTLVPQVSDSASYGPRQWTPIIPLLAFPIILNLNLKDRMRRAMPFFALLALSFLISLQSVLLNSHVYEAPPWTFVLGILK